MSVQITVRIPDDLAAFVDEEVARGLASSRADAVARALRHERRRRTALADVAILQAASGEHDLDALADHVAARPVALDD
jgi:Arc/MetJ-type ribon-helix-helix transcriptional regulator